MFAGIVECTGEVLAVVPVPGGVRLTVGLGLVTEGVREGDSISVNGVCLTAAQLDGQRCTFNIITETLSKTNLGALAATHRVNLERSLRVGDRIDGHFVQGHVDGVGQVVRRLASEREFKLWIKAPTALEAYIVPRGSVAVNGVSMTVAEVHADGFAMALIPTTLERTNLGQLQVNSTVNIETDILGRQIVHYLQSLGLNKDLPTFFKRLDPL